MTAKGWEREQKARLEITPVTIFDHPYESKTNPAASATGSAGNADLQARVEQLTKELDESKLTISEQQKRIDDYSARFDQKDVGQKNEEWVIELFSHFCYEDVDVAKSIIEEMSGKKDPEIADIIYERQQKNQISPKTNNIDMWRVLHAAKIIDSNSFKNLNTALRRRKERKQ